MELDEEKFRNSHADTKLEKPFTSDQLRKMVRDLVTKTRTQNLADFMHLPEIIDSLTVVDVPKEVEVEAADAPAEPWNMESFAPIENFAASSTPDNESWVQTNLNKFKVPQPKTDDDFLSEIIMPPKKAKVIQPEPEPKPQSQHREPIFAEPKISEADLETIVRRQTKEMLESIIWKLVPDMAERIIKEEVQRLLSDKDGQIQLD